MQSAEQVIHKAIKEFYLSKGRSEQQWLEVTMSPAKFNLVWRRALGLPGEGVPPAHLRKIHPGTGEILK